MWALALFWEDVAISVGRDPVGSKPDFICVGEPANRASNANFLSCNYPTPRSMACSVCLIIGGEDDARLRPN